MTLKELHVNCTHCSHVILLGMHSKGLLNVITLTDKSWPGYPSCELGKGHATANADREYEPDTLVTDAKAGRNRPRYLSVILETSIRWILTEPIGEKNHC